MKQLVSKISILVALILFAGITFAANPPQPTYGTADVNGNYGEWDLTNDFFAKMYEAGNPEKAHLSNLYLRYDCDNHVLYALVLRVGNWMPEKKEDAAWIKIYELGNSPQVSGNSGDNGVPPDFKWVYSGYTLLGYEASFSLAEGTYDEFEAHINIWRDKTSSTGKKAQGYIQLVLDCPGTRTGTIIIEKQTDPDGVQNTFTFTGDAAGSIADNGQIVVSNLQPGVYTSTELVPTGWTLSSIVLDDNNSTGDVNTATATFNLEAGETVKAVFTNTIEHCELDVEKTAQTSFTRTYHWTVKKTVTPEAFELCEEGETVVAKYKVEVDKTGYTDGMWAVTGTIKITNNSPLKANITAINDVVDGVTATITGVTLPYELPAGETVVCSYSANLPDGTNRVNTVTVTTSGHVKGGSATADVIFGSPTTLVNNSVHVDDSNGISWEFADDAMSVYVKEFTEVGEFKNTVIIRETQGQGEGQSASALVTITLKEPPEADFSAEPLVGIAPMEVQFTDLSEGAEGWEWNFGDGTTSNEQNPTHVYYGNPKHVTVTLKVWNCAGEDVKVMTNYITVNKPTAVNFEAAPLAGLPGLTVQFNNFTGGNASHYEWSYGDGQKEHFIHGWTNKVNPTHKYEQPGEYTVSLKASGDGGEDVLTLPGLVYVDSTYDYLSLQLVSSGKTYKGDGWDNAIDNDIFGSGCKVSAEANDAWAVFRFADGNKYSVKKLRLLADTIEPYQWGIHFVKEFEVWVSDDGENFELGFTGISTKKAGVWEIFEFAEPLVARYLKLKLNSARGTAAAYRELAEVQFFGKPATDIMVMQKGKVEVENEVLPTEFVLGQNYPNPFNPETSISYQLPDAAQVTLAVYSIEGKLIQTLVNGQVSAGVHRAVWNGMDEAGVKVSSGLYFYRFQAISQDGKAIVFTRKMTLMK